jgi:hypothetical protein
MKIDFPDDETQVCWSEAFIGIQRKTTTTDNQPHKTTSLQGFDICTSVQKNGKARHSPC